MENSDSELKNVRQMKMKTKKQLEMAMDLIRDVRDEQKHKDCLYFDDIIDDIEELIIYLEID